jgi:hypothetical protein
MKLFELLKLFKERKAIASVFDGIIKFLLPVRFKEEGALRRPEFDVEPFLINSAPYVHRKRGF